jgi:hypothetical protein
MTEKRVKQVSMGSEFRNGLRSDEALEALRWKLVANAHRATWRPPEEYVRGLLEAFEVINGIDNVRSLKKKRSIPDHILPDGVVDMAKLMSGNRE